MLWRCCALIFRFSCLTRTVEKTGWTLSPLNLGPLTKKWTCPCCSPLIGRFWGQQEKVRTESTLHLVPGLYCYTPSVYHHLVCTPPSGNTNQIRVLLSSAIPLGENAALESVLLTSQWIVPMNVLPNTQGRKTQHLGAPCKKKRQYL